MKIKITLLSDVCTSSGDTYNSYVDTDVVFNDCGLPYIPAKRIKGCIREAFLELVDFGFEGANEAEYKIIFGEEGNSSSAFELDNAYLDHYDAIVSWLDKNKDKEYAGRQNVLDFFTYVRTQTAVGENGAAEDKSLRTMRVVKKGLTFYAELKYGKELEKTENGALKNNFELAVSLVKHIGMARTRGLGLVNMEVIGAPDDARSEGRDAADRSAGGSFENLPEGINRLTYRITLKSPMLCKSPQGNQAKTQDYIEGAKLLGIIAGILKDTDGNLSEENKKMLSGITVSNAYPVCRGERCVPIPASVQKKKDQEYLDSNNSEKPWRSMECMNQLAEEEQNSVSAGKEADAPVQMTPVSEKYINSKGYIKNVESQISYHHRRPEDKSTGRATGLDGSSFYQLESLGSGQIFEGFVQAEREYAGRLLSALGGMHNIRMGYGRSAEYGRVQLALFPPEDSKGGKEAPAGDSMMTNQFAVVLNAPIILYNQYGMISADADDFTVCLAQFLNRRQPEEDALGSDKEKPDRICLIAKKHYLKYEQIGGFNVTWGRRKPVATVLGRGSVILFEVNKQIDISCLNGAFIGERTGEGYGEIRVVDAEKITRKYMLRKEAAPQGDTVGRNEPNDGGEIIKALKRKETIRKIKDQARRDAEDKINDIKRKETAKAAMAKLLLLARTEKDYESLKSQVESIEKESKKEVALKILIPVKKYWKDDKPEERGENFKIYLDSYLRELKYQLRNDNTGEAQK